MGRPRKPVALHLLKGNPSDLTEKELAERAAAEVHPHPLAPKPPADLSTDARECWEALSKELDRLGLLTVIDGPSFALACESWALARESLRQLRPRKADGTIDGRKKGREVVVPDTNHGGLKRHPAMSAYLAASREFREWCKAFGLGPAFRVNLRPGAPIGTVPDDDEDDEAFFGG